MAATTTAYTSDTTLNQANLVFDLDILILCVVALFVLLALPGAVSHFARRSEWRDGHFFRSVAVKPIHRPMMFDPKLSPINPAHISRMAVDPFSDAHQEKHAGRSEDDHTYSSHAVLVRNGSASSTSSGRGRQQNFPTHMPSWSTMLPGLTSVFSGFIRPGLSICKALLLLAYLLAIVIFGLFMSNPFTNFIRAGYVAVSQIPVIVILATKNNVLGAMIGYGYEKLNFLHRFAGRLFVLAVNVHAIGYFYQWTAAGTFQTQIANPNIAWGLAALIAADILYVLSLSVVRNTCYPVFLTSHVVSAIVLLGATCAHEPWTIPYVAIAVGCYAFDRVLRIVKTRYTTAHLRTLTELNVTRVEIPTINAGWRAGQFLRIRVLSRGMGWFGWAESHPFTIASVSRSPGEEGLVLMCKKAGDWTGKLFELGKRAEYGEACGIGRDVKVLVEGPYGGPGHSIVASFSGAMLVAGGSGITYALSTVQELLQKAMEGASRVRTVELVWSIPDPAHLKPMLPLFSSMIAQSQSGSTSLRISVFYTRAVTSSDAFKAFKSLPPGLTLAPGRPRLPKILEGVVDRTCKLFERRGGRSERDGPLTGVILGVCGPLALAEEAARAVKTVRSERRQAVGGVELHEEVFGW
ncbi:iron reductase [Sparassis latifolia]